MTSNQSFRVRFAVACILAVLATALLAPPVGADLRRGPMRGEVYSFSCGKCGADLGTSTSRLGPPGTIRCPRCGVRLVGVEEAPPERPKGPLVDAGSVVLLAITGSACLLFGLGVFVLVFVIRKLTGSKPTGRRSRRDELDFDDDRDRRRRSRRLE